MGTELPATVVQASCYTDLGQIQLTNLAACETGEADDSHGTAVAESLSWTWLPQVVSLYIGQSTLTMPTTCNTSADWMVRLRESSVINRSSSRFGRSKVLEMGLHLLRQQYFRIHCGSRAVDNGGVVWVNCGR